MNSFADRTDRELLLSAALDHAEFETFARYCASLRGGGS